MHSYLHGNPALIEAVRRLEHLGPDHFELYFTRRTATRIECKNQEVDALSRAEDVGLAIRLLKDRRMGFSFTTSLDKDAIERAVQAAAEIATVMPEDEFNGLESFGTYAYPAVDLLDSKGLQTPIERKIELAMRLEADCRKADARIQAVRSASMSEVAFETILVDSHGEHLQHKGSLFSASISCKAEENGDSQMGHDFAYAHELDSLDVSQVGRRAAELATEGLAAGKPLTMKCPAIIRNSVVANLIEFLSASFSAEEIDKGRSMLGGKMGERVVAEGVSLIDDGLLAGGYATSPFDGEGVPSTRTTLIDGGFMSGILYDGYYARKHGKTPTGSASRGIKSPPSIGASNLFMPKGKRTQEQLFDGITRGLLITNLMGIHTANRVTGDFSLGASGILIENGNLTRPVRGFAVAGNILEIFRGITDIGSDLRFFGSVGAPSVRIREIAVSGT